MTNDHFRQRRPDHRYRRLLPAAVAAVTIAASAPFVVPSAAEAKIQHRHESTHATPAGKIAALPRSAVVRGVRLPGNGST
jgi:hypothetical protein